MENIEDKLKYYRLRKRRQEKIDYFKATIRRLLMLGVKDENSSELPKGTTLNMHESEKEVYLSKPLKNLTEAELDDSDEVVLTAEERNVNISGAESFDSGDRFLKYTLRTVYIAFWFTLYIIAIELKFGIVFLMFSALAGIYLNTRTGPKKNNEISAYSVFNKNCKSIDGTLKAEQFEREIGIMRK